MYVWSKAAFFAWNCTIVLFAIAILINPWTDFPLPVVFEFHCPCFKMSLC